MRSFRKKEVLHVEDMKRHHFPVQRAAESIGARVRHASSVEQAERIIAKRLDVVERLLAVKKKKFAATTTSSERAGMLRQIMFLERLKERPFDLVVLDLNFVGADKKSYPHGVEFSAKLKEQRPDQKVLLHSDDIYALDMLSRDPNHERPYVSKLDYNFEKQLADLMKRMMKIQNVSRKK